MRLGHFSRVFDHRDVDLTGHHERQVYGVQPRFVLPPANGLSDPGLAAIGIHEVASSPLNTNPKRGRVAYSRGHDYRPLA